MRNLVFILFLFFIYSCSSPPQMKGFDPAQWRSDPKGCTGKRKDLASTILLHKKDWKGLDDDILLKLLGKPDQSFYYERNTKAFSYFIEPGNQCNGSKLDNEGKKIIAEINAIGFVSLIRIEN